MNSTRLFSEGEPFTRHMKYANVSWMFLKKKKREKVRSEENKKGRLKEEKVG